MRIGCKSTLRQRAKASRFFAAMLYDRPYMRETPLSGGTLWTTRLMIVTSVVFVLQAFLEVWVDPDATENLRLSASGLLKGGIWQLITFQFLHGGLLHLLLNLVVIFFFGRAIEAALGARRMLQLYFTSGVVGGLSQVLFQLVLSYWVPGATHVGVIGASAGAFGLVGAFALLFPERTITLLLFFILPVSMRARTLLYISVALGVFGLLIPMDNVAHAAHLGGLLGAALFLKIVVHGGFRMTARRLAPPLRRRPRVAVMSGGAAPQPPAALDPTVRKRRISSVVRWIRFSTKYRLTGFRV
jgi:membrane associated rhomboid family serine protease